MKGRVLRGTMVGITAIAMTVGVASCGTTTGSNSDTIVIGGKNFTEQDIMADMMKLLVEHDTKLHVTLKPWLDSAVTWNALQSNKIDVYVEYTGTGLVNILKQPTQADPQQVYDTVKKQFEDKYQVTWLKPIGFNNTYAMAMRKEEAQKLGITNISQLAAKSGDLLFGTEQDFIVRSDGLSAMNKLYKTHFKDVKSMEIGLKYKSLVDGSSDVIDVFSTDGKIPANNLLILKDDKQLFPPYYAAPIIRDSVLKAHPELKDVLNKLAGKISDEEMQKLNEAVDINHKKAMDVAQQWLQANGLLS